MTYALNELHNLIIKAAAGQRFATGQGHELAAAGVWLARRSFPVCGLIVRAISTPMRAPIAERRAGQFHFHEARAACDGLAAIDLAVATGPGGTTIVLHDLDNVALLAGLAGAAADNHGTGFAISDGSRSITVLPGGPLTPAEIATLEPAGAIRLEMARVTGDSSTASILRDGVIHPALATRYNPAAVADFGWDELAALAYKIYVPASEHSRQSGAGAGLTDND